MSTAVKERPILFSSGPMVRAMVDGRKSQTRRVVKLEKAHHNRPMPIVEWREQWGKWFGLNGLDTIASLKCPYGSVGDRLWIKEKHALLKMTDGAEVCVYAAHCDDGLARRNICGSCSYHCVTLSNGAADLLRHVSEAGGIKWDKIIDLAKHRVYKPHVDAYRTVEAETGIKPADCLMVTANPTFGDVEGAAAIGMPSQVIRQAEGPANIIELAWRLER